jgi:hypothetical protein
MTAGLVRSFGVVPRFKLPADVIQMPLCDDHELVEALDLQRVYEPSELTTRFLSDARCRQFELEPGSSTE